jgi:hypothetical protein
MLTLGRWIGRLVPGLALRYRQHMFAPPITQ